MYIYTQIYIYIYICLYQYINYHYLQKISGLLLKLNTMLHL